MNMVITQTFASTNEPSLISPYLNHKEASFIGLNLAEPSRIRNLSPINTASPAATKQAQPRGRSKEDDDEIGVFRAEKYFNGAIDADDTSSRSSSTTTATRSSCHGHQRYRTAEDLRTASALNLEQVRARIQPRTPSSVRSESSWNSRSVLLQSSTAKQSSTKTSDKKLINGKRFLSAFGCSCSDKNSVETKHVGEISFNKSSANSTSSHLSYKSSLHHHHHHHHHSTRSPSVNVEPIKIQKPPRLDILSSKSPYKSSPMFQCKSPEVFGPKVVSKTMSLERRLTMMSWDSPRQEEMVVFKAAAAAADSGSDASSDLFEIDSLTGKTNPFRARRASDEHSAGCATPTTGYAPSEASIQWSVVTASAADCSAMSDFEDSVSRAAARPARARARAEVAAAVAAAQVQQQRRRASALLGCKSQKSVSVAGGEAYRLSPGPSPRLLPPEYEPGSMRFRGDSPARFQAEIAKLSDGSFSARVGQEQRSLAHISRLASPSPRNNSHLLYSQ